MRVSSAQDKLHEDGFKDPDKSLRDVGNSEVVERLHDNFIQNVFGKQE